MSPLPAQCPGLFITGTDTEVGKTYVAAMIARALVRTGRRVGVYKPAASGCREEGGRLVSDDADALWEAAGCPASVDEVCPQKFLAPLAPHLAARAEGKEMDGRMLRQGIDFWRGCSDIVLVEGAGGLMSPMGDEEYVADLARDFGYPLLIVSANRLGTINQTLQTLITAAAFDTGLPVAGIVLNHLQRPTEDASLATNGREIAARSGAPLLAEVSWQSAEFSQAVDWVAWATRPASGAFVDQ